MHCATILTVFTKYERIHNAEKKISGLEEWGTREEWGKSEKDWGNGPKL